MLIDEIKLPANPYSRSREHCRATHDKLMKLVDSPDEEVALQAIKLAVSLDKQLVHLAADPRIAELMKEREAGQSKQESGEPPTSGSKLAGLKIVG